MSDGPTPDEVARAAQTLSKLRPGFIPFDLFIQFTRLMVASVVEVVPLKRTPAGLQVLLLPRASDDQIWPGMVHTPGTLLRATDAEESMEDAFRRIREETGNITFVHDPVFIETHFRKSRRGMENARMYYVEVSGPPVKGIFCSVDRLPDDLVPGQREPILTAADRMTRSLR